MAVNAVSWVLADAPGDARFLVDSTLPVIAQLLGAKAVVLVSEHPALGGQRVCLGAPSRDAQAPSPHLVADVVRTADVLARSCEPTGVMRSVAELGCVLLVSPLPRSGQGDGYVVAALAAADGADATDLAILGTVTNQLAGAIESCRRLVESERSRDAAAAALREQAEQAVALARRNELLKQARHDLVGARQSQLLAEERQRIARDLHDSVAQHVLSMGMQVEWCRTASGQPDVVERLVEVKELARSTVDRIRSAIFELSGDDELRGAGLPAALDRLAEQHRGHGLAVTVRTPSAVSLPAPVERALFMVAKEALFNTVLHADATRAAVSLSVADGSVRLQVTDDGGGRAEDLRASLQRAHRLCADGHHRGLANVDDRVRQVGGRLNITDAPRRGVRLRVVIALEEDDA